MCELCEANSPDDGSSGCFASLRSIQGAAPLAPLIRLSLPALEGKTICLYRQFPIQSLKLNTQILPLVRKTSGIFYLQIKEESTMPTTEKLKQEIAEAEKKLAQERSRLQRLENRNPIMRSETGRNGRTFSLPEKPPWRASRCWQSLWTKRSSTLSRKRFLPYRKSELY